MANRFWKSQPVSGAIVSVTSPPQVRLTVASTTGMTTGDVRTVFGIVGTTEANGTWTITVIDATHIDLQGTTFANLYTSGGAVNGKWDATNTNNWVTTSGGTNYGQTVPGTSDAVTLDGSSGGGTVTVNGPNSGAVTVQSITCGAFTGTLDFSANNNNVTLTAVTGLSTSGTGTRTLNLGNGTWTFTGVGTSIINIATKTNLTLNTNSATFVFTATTASVRAISLAATQNLPAISISANSSGGSFTLPSSITYASLAVAPPNYVIFVTGTTTITAAMNINGTSLISPVGFGTDTPGATGTISSANNGTFTYSTFRDLTFAGGGTFSASNSADLGHNSGITITPPATGGGGSVYGATGGVIA